MKAFAYAAPREEAEVVRLLGSHWGETEILAGGTDLIGLMKQMVLTPERVVNIKEVRGLSGISADSEGVVIGAVTRLDEVLEHPALEAYPAVRQAIAGINSLQLQSQGTFAGELCQRPRCWYFRGGNGLLADGGRLVEQGDHRYHAIFGNRGPAKFVSASRIAPALIALGARVRVLGPAPEDETVFPVELLYQTPSEPGERELSLEPNQLVTHVLLPPAERWQNATYEVRHGAGPDFPLAAAAAALRLDGNCVSQARIVLGQVAPIPWLSAEAAQSLVGWPVTPETARAAGEAAVARATPLAGNAYKVQLARVAVERAILSAAGLETGGF